jgi:hypothetical protein
VKRIVMVLTVAAILAVGAVIGNSLPVMAQPPCGHDWCDWYQSCKWEYWGWDSGKGWELISTDGNC